MLPYLPTNQNSLFFIIVNIIIRKKRGTNETLTHTWNTVQHRSGRVANNREPAARSHDGGEREKKEGLRFPVFAIPHTHSNLNFFK